MFTHYKALGLEGLFLLFKRYFKMFKVFEVKIPKCKFPILLRNNTTDITVFYQVFLAQSYNLNYGLNPKTIIDCGANIGLSAVYFANRFPEAKIIAIEPEASNYKLLESNTKKYNNIFCVESGVWNKSTNLIIKEKGLGNWGFVVEEVPYSNKETIPAISINDILERYGIEEIDILKIDIEGSEKEVFEENFEKWLGKTKVLIIELHDGLRKGASNSFFRAISKYDFKMARREENLIFHFNRNNNTGILNP